MYHLQNSQSPSAQYEVSTHDICRSFMIGRHDIVRGLGLAWVRRGVLSVTWSHHHTTRDRQLPLSIFCSSLLGYLVRRSHFWFFSRRESLYGVTCTEANPASRHSRRRSSSDRRFLKGVSLGSSGLDHVHPQLSSLLEHSAPRQESCHTRVPTNTPQPNQS